MKIKRYILVVHRSGLLSACLTPAKFKDAPHNISMIYYPNVQMDTATHVDLLRNRERAYILPCKAKFPASAVYFTLIEGVLVIGKQKPGDKGIAGNVSSKEGTFNHTKPYTDGDGQ